MNTNSKTYKPVYIKCTEQNKGKRIIETLESLGGINTEGYIGGTNNAIYYIKPNHVISMIDPDTENEKFLNYFLNTAKEIKSSGINAQYCCILDFNTGKVFKHCITEDEINLTTEELLDKYGFNEDECSIMYTSNNLELELLKD